MKSLGWRSRDAKPKGRVSAEQLTEVRAKIYAPIWVTALACRGLLIRKDSAFMRSVVPPEIEASKYYVIIITQYYL